MAMNPRIADWQDRRVWIVGASSGIGAALARALVARGARVAVSARSAEPLAALSAEHPGRVLAVPCDATKPNAAAAALAEIVGRWEGVDLAVYAAGAYVPQRTWELTPDAVRTQFGVNVIAACDWAGAVVPRLLAQGGGGIALVSSVAGYRALPRAAAYGATKAALIHLAEALYLDLAPRGIAVHLVNPGFVRTPLTAGNDFEMPALIEPEEAAAEIVRGFERGRFEIHFPRRFTVWLKLLRLLPYRWYFPVVHRLTGL